MCMDYIRVLEGMLRTCVLDHKGRGLIALSGIRLQQQLQASIQMASYEALYGRPCRSLLLDRGGRELHHWS